MEVTGKLASIVQITWHRISEDRNLPTGLPLSVPSMHYVVLEFNVTDDDLLTFHETHLICLKSLKFVSLFFFCFI
jgi:hypothetical protein